MKPERKLLLRSFYPPILLFGLAFWQEAIQIPPSNCEFWQKVLRVLRILFVGMKDFYSVLPYLKVRKVSSCFLHVIDC